MNPSYSAVYFSLNRIRYKSFISLSIIIRIISYSSYITGSFDISNLTIKSIITSFYGKSGSFVYWISP